MAKLFDRFGNWPSAIAAYNWGPTNVAKKGLLYAPSETRNYIRDISRDVDLI